MSRKKALHLLSGLAICLSWYGINAKEAQSKQQSEELASLSFEAEDDTFFFGDETEAWNAGHEETSYTSEESTYSDQAPSLEDVLQELSNSAEDAAEMTEETAEEESAASTSSTATLEDSYSEETPESLSAPESDTAQASSFPEETLVAEEEAFAPSEVENINVEELSEAFGHFIGKNLESPGFEFDVEAVIRGIQNAVEGHPSPMNDEEYEQALSYIQENAFQVLAEQNLKEANEFLKNNAHSESVIEIEEGKVQYEVKKEGEGKPVAESAAPLIHYKGSYLDGSIFGSSENSDPVAIPLDQTIPGLSKAIVGMKEGEQRKIFIHPEEGYGTTSHLPPNSLLVFDVEVLQSDTMTTPHSEIASDLETEANEFTQ